MHVVVAEDKRPNSFIRLSGDWLVILDLPTGIWSAYTEGLAIGHAFGHVCRVVNKVFTSYFVATHHPPPTTHPYSYR